VDGAAGLLDGVVQQLAEVRAERLGKLMWATRPSPRRTGRAFGVVIDLVGDDDMARGVFLFMLPQALMEIVRSTPRLLEAQMFGPGKGLRWVSAGGPRPVAGQTSDAPARPGCQ